MSTATATRKKKEAKRKAAFAVRTTYEHNEIGEPKLTARQLAKGAELREKCRHSLLNFNRLCFPNSTGLKPFGPVQLDSIEHDEEIILHGGALAKAEPRGFGKTTRGCNASLWAGLFGYRRMISVFSASLDKSKTQIMARWKTELLHNDLLFWMFPKLIWAIRKLGNKPQAAASQTYNGKLTKIQWNADRIVLPTIPGEEGSGSIFLALPLKSCRGATHALPNGTVLRPDLLIFDDVQTDEDSENPQTVRKLIKLIEKTAMMLGGHSKTLSAIMNCTVLNPDDLSEYFLNNQTWGHVRYKMLAARAKHEKEFWLTKYAEVRRACDPEDPIDRRRAHMEAMKLYKANRKMANEGADPTWEWGYGWADDVPTEISATQHAYNILIDRGEDVFLSECQNEPPRDTGGLTILIPEKIRNKQSGYKRNVVPPEVTTLSAFVDVHPQILYWIVWAWEPRFTGYLIDYGTFPNQQRRSFSHDKIPVPLERLFPGLDDPARITVALESLIHGNTEIGVNSLLNREWVKTDGVPLKISMCGVDANGSEADAIKKFIRKSVYTSILYPSFGRGIGAATPPMSSWQQSRKHKGKYGPEWVPAKANPGDPPGINFDTNYWKTRFHKSLSLAKGSQGELSIFTVDNPEFHRMLSDHWYSERPKHVICGSREVYEFPKAPAGDNHLFDCAIGAMVAASKAGIASVAGKKSKMDMDARRKRISELARRS